MNQGCPLRAYVHVCLCVCVWGNRIVTLAELCAAHSCGFSLFAVWEPNLTPNIFVYTVRAIYLYEMRVISATKTYDTNRKIKIAKF